MEDIKEEHKSKTKKELHSIIEIKNELEKSIENNDLNRTSESGAVFEKNELKKQIEEGFYLFEKGEHVARTHVCTYLKELQQTGVQSDVVLQCQNGSLLAHKSLLAIHSHLLKNAFTSEPENCEVMLPELPTSHVTAALELLYTGEASVKACDKDYVVNVLDILGVRQDYDVHRATRDKRGKQKLRIKHEKNLSSRKITGGVELAKLPEKKPKKRVFMANLDPSQLTCSFSGCGKRFPALYKLKLHLLTHSKTCPFMCSSCGRGFKNKYKMHQHEKQTHPGLKLKPVSKLAKQMHKPKRPLRPCLMCTDIFDTVTKLRKHIQECHRTLERITCPHCQILCKSRKNLATHLKLVHNDSESQLRFGCSDCGRRFEKRSHLEDHVLRHSSVGQFACMFCPKRCATKQDLDRHLSSHKGEANFICQVCAKEFVYRKTYTQHVRKHLGHKPYVCKACEKSFTLLETLKKHQASHQRKGDNTRIVTAGKGVRGVLSFIETIPFPDLMPIPRIEKRKAETQVYIPGPNYIYSESITPLNQMQVITDYTEISSMAYAQNSSQYSGSGQYNGALQHNNDQYSASQYREATDTSSVLAPHPYRQYNEQSCIVETAAMKVLCDNDDIMDLFSPPPITQTETPIDKL